MEKELRIVKIEALKEYARNNKIHSEISTSEMIKSISKNGYIAPIICDENLEILAGHGRKKALEKMGKKQVEVMVVSGLTEEQKRDYRIRDNKLNELSEWNMENINFEIQEMKQLGREMEELENIFLQDTKKEDVDNMDDSFNLPEGEKGDLEQMTFILHTEQAEQIRKAILISKEMGEFIETGNDNSNGNAISRICEIFILQNKQGKQKT